MAVAPRLEETVRRVGRRLLRDLDPREAPSRNGRGFAGFTRVLNTLLKVPMPGGGRHAVTEGKTTRNVGKPSVLIVGGPDVDSRLDLMEHLSGEFALACVGAEPALEPLFAERGFRYDAFHMRGAVSPWSDLRSLTQLLRICRKRRPDVVHAFATKPAVWGRLAASLAGVPVVVGTLPGLGSLYVTDGPAVRGLRRVYQGLQALSCRRSSATVFQNSHDRDQMVDAGVVDADSSLIIPGSGVRDDVFAPDAVDPGARHAVRAEMGAGAADVVVTMIARLIRPKGVLEFAAAARSLQSAHPEARFVLAGPLTEESVDALTPAELAEVNASVTWLGARTDVPALLAASDTFVLPSYYREGMPRVLLEAGAMKLPLVAADVPGSRDVVEHGVNGWLVEARNVKALRDALAGLIRDPALRARMGTEARRTVVERFSVDVIARHHADLYTRLLEQASAPGTGRTTTFVYPPAHSGRIDNRGQVR